VWWTWNNSGLSAGTAWHLVNATGFAGGPTAASGSKLLGYTDPISGDADVYYVGTDQHLHLLVMNSTTTAVDVTAAASGPNAVAGTYFARTNNGNSIYYLGTDGNVWQSWNNGAGSSVSGWHSASITGGTGATLATSASSLYAYTDPYNTQDVYYVGTDQHVHLLWYDGTSWHTNDLTGATGGSAVRAGTLFVRTNTGNSIYYLGADGSVWQSWNNGNSSNVSGWHSASLNGIATAPSGGTGNSLYAYTDPVSSNQADVYYVGSDQHVHLLWWNGDPWHTVDVSEESQTITDSGTVSLSVAGFTVTACYGNTTNPTCVGKPVNITTTDVAAALMLAVNVSASPATATQIGSNIGLTLKAPGPLTPAVSALSTSHDNPNQFGNPSFTSSATNFAGGQGPAFDSTAYVTNYQYDALGNLLRVDQKGTAPNDTTQWRTRTFTYDSLSRLLTANNPESGTITYAYDPNGNLSYKTSPQANQIGTATTTISYCYDPLNRLLAKGYSNSPAGPQQCSITPPYLPSPAVVNTYDVGTNGIGRLTSLTDLGGGGIYTYDLMGRIKTEQRTTAGFMKSLTYSYDLAGFPIKLTYPSTRVVNYTADAAGRVISATDGAGTSYISGVGYNSAGTLNTFVNGSSITNNFIYNPRLQLCRITAFTSGSMSPTCDDPNVHGNLIDRSYSFNLGTDDNGNVVGITNYRDNSRSQSFGYDWLNRIILGASQGSAGALAWGENYSIDAWGNLTISRMAGKPNGNNFTCSSDNLNRVTCLSYDAAGNVTSDGIMTYSYDQENRLLSAGGETYTYDADGKRIKKSGGTADTLYWYAAPGIIAESDLSGNLKSEYVFFAGRRTARIDLTAGSIHYYLSDHLSSTSMVVTASGVPEEESDYSPFGTEYNVTSGPNRYKFTGKERDTSSGNDYFGARYYASKMGRFLLPDPITISPAHLENPQRWNEYAYGLNDPLINVDINGRFSTDGHTAITTAGFLRAGVKSDSHYAKTIMAANHAVDTGHYIGFFQAQLGPQHQSDHFLKAPEPENQIGAYNAAMSKIHGLADSAYSSIKRNGLDSAANDIGTALHTIQDSYAHTERDSSGAIVQVDCFTCVSALGTGEHTHNDPDATNRDGSMTDPANAAAYATAAYLELMNSAGHLTQAEFEQQYQQFVDTYFRQKLPDGQQQR
jgi:RHS repeat-associated protein